MSVNKFNVRSISDFFNKAIVFTTQEEVVWYRGNKCHDYYLEPSAYRSEKFKENSMETELTSILFGRSRMLHIPETSNINGNIIWLSYLQHNGTPSRLLDWTYDVSVALYFAFEEYIEKTSIMPGRMPSVWILKPNLFIEEMIAYIKQARNTLGLKRRDVTYIGNFFNKNQPKQALEIVEEEKKKKKILEDIYIPFFSPFVNERAKLQGGCFIRFPLLNKGTKNEFENHRLEEFVSSSPIFKDCLGQFIFTQPEKIAREELNAFNLDTSRIYPEVENIAKEIKRSLFDD